MVLEGTRTRDERWHFDPIHQCVVPHHGMQRPTVTILKKAAEDTQAPGQSVTGQETASGPTDKGAVSSDSVRESAPVSMETANAAKVGSSPVPGDAVKAGLETAGGSEPLGEVPGQTAVSAGSGSSVDGDESAKSKDAGAAYG